MTGSFKTKSGSVVILCMLQFLPSNTQLLARALSSNLSCLKNISRNRLSSNSLLKLGRNTTQQWILEVVAVRKISLLFSHWLCLMLKIITFTRLACTLINNLHRSSQLEFHSYHVGLFLLSVPSPLYLAVFKYLGECFISLCRCLEKPASYENS